MSIPAQEKGRKNENNYTTIAYKHFQEEMVEMSANVKANDSKEEKISTRVKWVAFKDQFFSTVLIANDYFENASLKSTMIPEPSPYLKRFTAFMSVPLEHKAMCTIPLKIYFGPNHFNTLKSYHEGLEEIVGMGRCIVKYINRWAIIPVFDFLNRFINNYGIIILILTILLKIVLFPLTYRSYLSQAKMKVLKPQIDEINERIPKEKAMERQQATMALYRKVGVSSLGGCLPMLLQFPILIAMFRFFPTSFELRQQSFLWATDLSTYDSIFEWQAHIPLISDFYGNHISLFTILMTVATVITIQMSNQANTSAQMPGMKTMTYIMPFMFMFMLNNFSAGLTYYYFLANLITIGQNYAFKSVVDEEELLRKLNENKKKPAQRSKFQEKLEQMAKQRGYKLPKK
jgi:YidC/Oxa1 family membrane protein insertase